MASVQGGAYRLSLITGEVDAGGTGGGHSWGQLGGGNHRGRGGGGQGVTHVKKTCNGDAQLGNLENCKKKLDFKK